MKLILFLTAAVALSACGPRDGAATVARPDTATMGAGPASAPASAASTARGGATRVAPSKQDLDAGRKIATEGSPGAPACISCHGANGEGNAQAGFPRIGGQGRLYIEHQLDSFADGTRAHPVLTPIAGALCAQQRAQVAGFYAGLSPGAAQQAAANPRETQEPPLVAHGDSRRGLQACASCHGPQGQGDGASMPSLAGQHEPYLVGTLAAWKDGSRHNDPTGRMPAIAKALDEAEARSIAAYFSRLPPPAPGQTTR
jgi:cytochrome c553